MHSYLSMIECLFYLFELKDKYDVYRWRKKSSKNEINRKTNKTDVIL